MKKIFCVLLSALLLCAPLSLAAEALSEEVVPVVLVRGMDLNGLYVDYGTENQTPCVQGINAQDIVKVIFQGLFRLLTRGSLDAFCEPVVEYVNGIMGTLACDTDGNSVYPVGTATYPEAVSNYPELTNGSIRTNNEHGIVMTCAEEYGAENTYFFNYDWRIDPVENAALVHEMIERAKAEHHCDKVNLICASMGGAVTVTYLSLYGYESIQKCIFLSSTFCGTYVATDLLNGRLHTDADGLYAIAMRLLGESKTAGLIDMLYKTRILHVLARIANRFYEKEADYVYDNFLRDCFGTMPALWALVLPEDFDTALAYVFNTPALRTQYAGVIEKATRANAIMANAEALLQEADEFLDIVVMASYGTPLIPVYAKATTEGDGTLETALMAGGATVADFGETLPADYVPGNAKYLSPDRAIDLSTALFPDYTWIFQNAPHVSCSYGTDTAQWLLWALDYEGQPTVNSSDTYPQFMLSNKSQTLTKY